MCQRLLGIYLDLVFIRGITKLTLSLLLFPHFFFFLQFWQWNSGPPALWANILPLEPHPQLLFPHYSYPGQWNNPPIDLSHISRNHF
jgi:hypothetical protein